MKKYSYLTAILFISAVLFSSCLEYGIDAPEYSTDCEITSIQFEHRWALQTGNVDGIYSLYFKTMTLSSNIDATGLKVTIDITVPTVDNNNKFTLEERNKVSLSSLACLFYVSNAASVTPLNGAPVLGTLGDYSGGVYTYRVTSASGVYKDWQIIINSFTK